MTDQQVTGNKLQAGMSKDTGEMGASQLIYRPTLALLPFQKRWLKATFAPGIRTSILSISRGNGKSTLCSWLLARSLTPGDTLCIPGSESHLVAGSLGQVRRTSFRILRRMLEDSPRANEYRISESSQQAQIVHEPTDTRVSCLASSGRTSLGLVATHLLVADEPASWKTVDGELLADSIFTAHAKPGSRMKVIFIGTIAPSWEGTWWHTLANSASTENRHVTCITGGTGKWDSPHTVQRANPLSWKSPDSRKTLLLERDEARVDSRLKARFESFHLNRPARDEASTVLSVADWKASLARPVPPRSGKPICGLDMGRERAWTSVAALWPNGRLEVTAICPGVPNLAEQASRDGIGGGLYQELVQSGSLIIDVGRRRVSADLIGEVIREFSPRAVFADKDRVSELSDAGITSVVSSIMGWSLHTSNIRALRKLAGDGPLSVAPESRSIIEASLRESSVQNSDAGGHRLVKRRAKNRSRDDVVASVLMAAGQFSRLEAYGRPTWRYLGSVG